MRVLKMDLLRAPAVRYLVEHHLGDLHFGAADPGDTAAIQFNLRGEDSSHWCSPGTSIREGKASRRRGLCAAPAETRRSRNPSRNFPYVLKVNRRHEANGWKWNGGDDGVRTRPAGRQGIATRGNCLNTRRVLRSFWQ